MCVPTAGRSGTDKKVDCEKEWLFLIPTLQATVACICLPLHMHPWLPLTMISEGKSKCSCHVERICATWLSMFAMMFFFNHGVNVQTTLTFGRQGILQSASSEVWFNMAFVHSDIRVPPAERCCTCLWFYDDPEVPQIYFGILLYTS